MPSFFRKLKSKMSSQHEGEYLAPTKYVDTPPASRPTSSAGRRPSVNSETTLVNGPPTPPSEKTRSDDLWEQATKGLSEEHQNMLKGVDTSGDRLDVLNGLLQVVQRRHEEVEARQWKITVKGKPVVLRDVTANILGWVEKFAAIGDLVATFQPVVATPWAVIRLVVQMGVNDTAQMGLLLVSVDYLTNLLDRCELYELLHLRDNNFPTKSQVHLRESLVVLYTAVLEYLMDVMTYLTRNTAGRFFSSVGEEEIFDISGVESQESAVSMAYNVAEADNTRIAHKRLNETAQATLRALLQDVCAPLERIEDDVSELRRDVEGKQRLQMLNWYSTLEYGLHHKRAAAHRVENTGMWLLDTKQYQTWAASEVASILWVHGIPGSGKTKLASAVIDHLRGERQMNREEAVVYHYCNSEEPDTTLMEGVILSIIRQLATRGPGAPVDEVLVNDFNHRRIDGFASGQPHLRECWKLMSALLAKRSTDCCVVIDGLEECHQDDVFMGEFLTPLFKTLQSAPVRVQLFITSRDKDSISRWMKTASPVYSLYLGGGANYTAPDLEAYIRQEIQQCIKKGQLLDGNIEDELRERICRTLVKNANGMFDWCREQIEQICECAFSSEIGEFLNERPEALDKSYEETFRSINSQKGAAAIIGLSSLRWITWSAEPLTLSGLCDAIYTELRSRDMRVSRREITVDIIQKCAGYLIVTDQETGHFRTSHTTVTEYMKAQYADTQLAFEALAANVCLRVLLELGSSNFDRGVSDGGLESYALKNWLTHVLASSETGDFFPEDVMQALSVFIGTPDRPTEAFLYWYYSLQHQHQPLKLDIRDVLPHLREQKINALSVAAGYGFFVPEFWQSDKYDPNQRNRSDEPLLAVAISHCQHDPKSVCGHRQIAHMLLSRGADVNIACGQEGYPLLAHPIVGNNYSYVDLLLRAGASPDGVAHNGNSLLQLAMTQGSQKIVDLLLQYDANVNYRAGYFGTPLQCAAYIGNPDLVRLLLAKGADPNLIGGHWNSALEAAIGGREYDVARLLLAAGARVSNPPTFTPASRYGSPLYAACHPYRYDLAFLDELLTRVTPEDLNDGRGDLGPPLAVAASVGNAPEVSLVERLLAKGADPNSTGGIYGSMVGAAAIDGNKEVLLRAVSAGANMDIEAGFIGTPLAMACWSNHSEWQKDIIQFFLKHGADVNHVYGEYGTPLQCAAANGNLEFVEALLAAGAAVNIFSPRGYGSALQAAISTGRHRIEQLLRSKGAALNPAVSGAPELPPTGWSVTDITREILSPDHLEACYSMRNTRPYTLLANHPIPLTAEYFYFEVTLSAANANRLQPPRFFPHFTIGLAHACIPAWARPGDIEDTVLESWGYHAETGELRSYPDANSARDMLLSQHVPYREGDTVGMGVFPRRRTAFYTLNGEVVGTGAVGLKGRLFPSVWLGSPVRARVNFGAEEFKYEGGRDVERAREDAGKKYGKWKDPLPLPDTF